MLPISDIQKIKVEYSALETVLKVCSDDTIRSLLSSRLRELTEKMENLLSVPQQVSFAASTAAAASPAIIASAQKVTDSAITIELVAPASSASASQSMGKESDSKLNKDDYYGTFKWISQVANDEIEAETAKILEGIRFENPQFVKEVVKERVLLSFAIFAYPILWRIAEENNILLNMENFKLTNRHIDFYGFKRRALFSDNKINWFDTIKIKTFYDGDDSFRFHWDKNNEYLNWWVRGGNKLFLQYIKSKLPKRPSKEKNASTANASLAITTLAPKITATAATMGFVSTSTQLDQKASLDSKKCFKVRVIPLSETDGKEFNLMSKKLDIKGRKESELDDWFDEEENNLAFEKLDIWLHYPYGRNSNIEIDCFKTQDGGSGKFIGVQGSNNSVDYYKEESYETIIEKIKESHCGFSYCLQMNQKSSAASYRIKWNKKPSVDYKRIKESLLKSNPEYRTLSEVWDKALMPIADQVKRLKAYKAYAFGTDQWGKYVGQIVGEIPPLPADLDEILDREDPGEAVLPGKVGDTHVLTLVPEAVLVDGWELPITLLTLLKLLEKAKNGGHKIESGIFEAVDIQFARVKKAHWVLLRKEVIKEAGEAKRNSRIPYHKRQENIVLEYSQLTKTAYQFPTAIDAAASCFLHFVRSGQPPYHHHIRCIENCMVQYQHPLLWKEYRTEHRPVIVGITHPNETCISVSHGWYEDNDCVNVGVARVL